MTLPSKKTIEQYKADKNFVEEVARQIQKDFQLYDEEIKFSGSHETAYNELFEQILPVMSRMLNLDSARFFALLYTIDIDERKIKSLLFEKENIDTAHEISHLILERELLKVLTRKLYTHQSNI